MKKSKQGLPVDTETTRGRAVNTDEKLIRDQEPGEETQGPRDGLLEQKPLDEDTAEADATHERTPIQNEKLIRDQAARGKNMGPKNCLPAKNAAGLNEKDDEDEMEDLYREEENRGTVESV